MKLVLGMDFGRLEDLGLNPKAQSPVSRVTSEKLLIVSGCREPHL